LAPPDAFEPPQRSTSCRENLPRPPRQEFTVAYRPRARNRDILFATEQTLLESYFRGAIYV
jgi:hypothetical protein